MRAVVVYESFKGNTKHVAEAVGEALRESYDVSVLPVGPEAAEAAREADLLVLGGPTWAHGPTSRKMREQNPDAVSAEESTGLDVGAREWLETLPPRQADAAAFDTRVNGPRPLTGAASKKLARWLEERGYHLVAAPESFLVTRHEELVEGELEHARTWGRSLVSQRGPTD